MSKLLSALAWWRLAMGWFVACLMFASASPCRGQSTNQDNSAGKDQSSQGTTPNPKDGSGEKKNDKNTPPAMTRIRILVTSNTGKPIENASVYVRFPESGGFLHHDKQEELDLKTNEDGSVKVPPVPQGKILIQVVAKGWKTFGKWYEIDVDQQTIEIKLDPPPHWY